MQKSSTKPHTKLHKQSIQRHKQSHGVSVRNRTLRKPSRTHVITHSNRHSSTTTASITPNGTKKATKLPFPGDIEPIRQRYQVVRIGKGVERPTKLFESTFIPSLYQQDTYDINNIVVDPWDLHGITRSDTRVVLQHALLASKTYWTPFIRSLHSKFATSNEFTTPIDLYIPDLAYHNETAMVNDPKKNIRKINSSSKVDNNIDNDDTGQKSSDNSTSENYLDHLTGDLHCFLTECVLTNNDISNVITKTSSSIPDVAIMGHSLGARTAMLWNLYLNNTLNSNNDNNTNNTTQIIKHLSTLPIISLDASPSTYHHDHQLLFRALIGVEDNMIQWLQPPPQQSTTPATAKSTSSSSLNAHLKQGLLSISPELDDNTIAFVLQNNLSAISLGNLYNTVINHSIGSEDRDNLNNTNDKMINYDYVMMKIDKFIQQQDEQKTSKNPISDPENQSSNSENQDKNAQKNAVSPSLDILNTTPIRFWTSNIQELDKTEHYVHKWPIPTPTDANNNNNNNNNSLNPPKIIPTATSTLPLLAIGGLDSHRLVLESNLTDLKHFFPNVKVEMIRGGHFAHQGVDSVKAATYSVDYLSKQFYGNNDKM